MSNDNPGWLGRTLLALGRPSARYSLAALPIKHEREGGRPYHPSPSSGSGTLKPLSVVETMQ